MRNTFKKIMSALTWIFVGGLLTWGTMYHFETWVPEKGQAGRMYVTGDDVCGYTITNPTLFHTLEDSNFKSVEVGKATCFFINYL